MELGKIVFYTKEQGPGSFPFHEKHLELLRKAAPDTQLVFTDWDEDKLLREADGCVAAVAQNNRPLPTKFYKKAKDLKWVHCMMSGVDKMRVPGSEHVILTSTKGVHGIPLSEHVLGLMLCAARGLHLSRDNQAKKAWSRPGGITELNGATAGVVGLGLIGTEVARLLGAVGLNVVAMSAVPPTAGQAALIKEYYSTDRFRDFLAVCDYVILSVPLTVETYHMFSFHQFKQMKPGAWIINVARGQVIDETDLLEALKTGEIAGACLDVAETEPRPESDPLWEMPNVILTPHTANATPKKMDRIVGLFLENVRRYQQDEPLLYQER